MQIDTQPSSCSAQDQLSQLPEARLKRLLEINEILDCFDAANRQRQILFRLKYLTRFERAYVRSIARKESRMKPKHAQMIFAELKQLLALANLIIPFEGPEDARIKRSNAVTEKRRQQAAHLREVVDRLERSL